MPERAATVPYNPVPSAEPQINATGPMSVRANPNEFGAQVSEQMQQTGNEVFQMAQKQQGMINETAMTKADADFAVKVGQIKGQYTTLTGQSAFNAFPQYQTDIKTAFDESRAGLPPAAQRGFDMMATRTMANHIADGSSYASSQLKEANRDAYSSMANANMQALLDPSIASDPKRAEYHLDSLKYAAQAQVDENSPGLKTDPESGAVNFDESTHEGQHAKAQFQQKLDSYLTQGYINRYDTLAKSDVFGAFDQYQNDRDNMPRAAQVALDASFAPKLFNAHVQTGVGTALVQAEQDHANLLYNPSASSIDWTMRHEGGFVPNDSGKGPTKFGINQEANPDVDIANLTSDQAAKIMHDRYWTPVGAENMSPQMAQVAFDTAVNMGVDKAKTLVEQSSDDPQKLIDLRRSEYERLARSNPEKYGQYLTGWNQRLDDLQSGIQMEGKSKPYGANPDGSPLTAPDYFKTHSADVYARGDAYAEQQMPGDLALKRSVRQSLENYMNKAISNQSQQYMMDNRNVVRAINGDLTKGKSPETEQELRTIPGMASLLDRVSVQDPKFAEGIPTMIAKMSRQNTTTNSANGYDTILRALEPHDEDHPNAIASVDHLDRALGRSDGTGINMKDYNDAKPALELDHAIKDKLSKTMQEITVANGNLDGQGKNRALQWYNQTMMAWKQNEALGDKKLPPSEFSESVGEKSGPPMPAPPSRMKQIENWASSLFKSKQQPFDYNTIQKGQQYTAPDGTVRIKH